MEVRLFPDFLGSGLNGTETFLRGCSQALGYIGGFDSIAISWHARK